MVKSELIRALQNKLPELHERDVMLAVDCMLKQLEDALVQGDRIEVRGFGSFNLHHRPARLTRNPKTGVSVQSPATVKVYFKAGKEMRERVNLARDYCDITK